MEILFLSYSIRIELILLILSGSIAIILAGIYGYAFIRQIREIFFGDKKRDALLSKRNSELLTKRQEGDEDTTETPPPIVLDELENIDAVNIDQLEAALESAEWSPQPHTSPETTFVSGTAMPQEESDASMQETPVALSPEILDTIHTEHVSVSDTPETGTENEDTIWIGGHEIELNSSWDEHTPSLIDEPRIEESVETPSNEDKAMLPGTEDTTKNTHSKNSPISSAPIEIETIDQTENTQTPESSSPETPLNHSDRHIEELFEMTQNAKTLFARGSYADARAIIVAGLALKKDHRDLTLLLGNIYESEEKFSQAELIYKDLAHAYPEDHEVLSRLASVLVITKKYSIAYELYKKILALIGNDEDSLYVITHLAKELGLMDDLYMYARLYLKSWPTNKDILALMAEAEIELWKRKEAIQTLIKLKNLSPYDAQAITDMITKLVAEEEMAENFWEHSPTP